MTLQHLRSSTANKRPDPTAMADGQIALNTAAASPGLFYKDSAGNLVKAGPVHVGSTAPNVSPASGGTAGNSTGEAWLDTSGSNPLLKIWSGAAWQTAQPVVSGTVVSTADTGSVTSTMIANGTIVDADVNASAAIAGTKISPNFGSQNVVTTGTSTAASFIPTSSTVPTNGVYLPSANNVAISTNGTGRLFVDASGNVGVGTASPTDTGGYGRALDIQSNTGAAIYLRTNDGTSQIAQGSSDLTIRTRQAHPIIFNTDNVERLRITSDGKLGLGVSSPQQSIDTSGNIRLSSGGSRVLEVLQSVNAAAYTGPGFYSASSLGYGVSSGGTHRWIGGDGNTELMRLTSTGLGVGTTSPGGKLAVYDASAATFRLETPGVIAISHSFDGTNYTINNNDSSSGHPLIFGTKVSGGESARIDNSGRLLVGTSSVRDAGSASQSSRSPLYFIEGAGANAFSLFTGILGRADAAGPNFTFAKTRSNSLGANTIVQDGDTLGRFDFAGADGTDLTSVGASIKAEVDGTPGTDDMPGRLVFSTTADGASSPTERMRLDSAGRLDLFGATNCIVSNSIAAAGTTYTIYAGRNSGVVGNPAGGTDCFYVYTNGNVVNTNNSYGAISDIKLKENIVDAGSQWDDLKALQVRKYNFKEGQTHTQIGLIAQEVELVSPGLVSESPDRDEEGNDLGTVTKSVNYSVLYMKAVKALQEVMERIETLEAKVAALEGA